MDQPTSQIERLDWAAKALPAEELTSWAQVYVIIWSPLVANWDLFVHRREVAYAAAALAVAATLMRWFHRRSAILTAGLVEMAIGDVFLYLGGEAVHNTLGRISDLLIAVGIVVAGFKHFESGMRYAAVQGDDWLAERVRVRQWLEILQRMAEGDKVIEIKVESFKVKRTYRFLMTGNCWAVATFKAGEEKKHPLDYRIRGLSEIALEKGPHGTLMAHLDGKTIPRRRL
jgi:hypothetical protein